MREVREKKKGLGDMKRKREGELGRVRVKEGRDETFLTTLSLISSIACSLSSRHPAFPFPFFPVCFFSPSSTISPLSS
ncbi:hypothetical protein, partial [Thiolapillus sp.]|uniref:hypothetical protein n=1 Tax=Thiolapillus sp. TaxID=2017437 RepID=UPI003AF68659